MNMIQNTESNWMFKLNNKAKRMRSVGKILYLSAGDKIPVFTNSTLI